MIPDYNADKSERDRLLESNARAFDAWNAEHSPFITADERCRRDGAPWCKPAKVVRGEQWEVGP